MAGRGCGRQSPEPEWMEAAAGSHLVGVPNETRPATRVTDPVANEADEIRTRNLRIDSPVL